VLVMLQWFLGQSRLPTRPSLRTLYIAAGSRPRLYLEECLLIGPEKNSLKFPCSFEIPIRCEPQEIRYFLNRELQKENN